MAPLQPKVTSHHDVLARNQMYYEAGVMNGSIVPFIYPMGTYGAFVLLLFLLVPPQSVLHSKITRYTAFALVMGWHVWMIIRCKASRPPNDFGLGILSAWGTIWAASILIFRDGKAEHKRIEHVSFTYSSQPNDSSAKSAESTSSAIANSSSSPIRHRNKDPNSTQSFKESANGPADSDKSDGLPREKPLYHWRRYSKVPYLHRLDWTMDLVTNFRGVGWEWKVAGLPSYPAKVQQDLQSFEAGCDAPKDDAVSKTGICRFDDSQSLFRHNIWLVVKGYLILDALKTLMNHDPYFWGLVDQPPPAYFPVVLLNSALLVRGYRLLVSLFGIWICLRTIFSLGPLFFVGVFGTKHLGVNGEPWLYPDHFGSYRNVLDRGLAGFWGGWWHQTFRSAFQAGGEWMASCFGVESQSTKAKIIQLFTAFALSGLIHVGGSMTQMPETRPWSGPFLFFILQPFGMMLEIGWKVWLKQSGYGEKIPKRVAQLANLIYANGWLFLTAPLITNDFARGGVWLFEPVMFSLFRGLGFGVEGDGVLCWNVLHWARWHWDTDRFWLSGFVL